MGQRAKRGGIALVVVSAVAVGSVGLADAASKVKHKRVHQAAAANPAAGAPETHLTGVALQSASSAATAAVPGGTVDRASTENASESSGAAYEVHVTKADGHHVVVLEDSSFKVVSVTAGHGGGGDHGGPGGGHANEPVLTGATLTSAADAATAAVPGGKVTRASSEDRSDPAGAAYEVHVTKTDGREVEVVEDSAFKVLSVTAGHGPGRPGPGPGPDPGPGGAGPERH